MSRNLDRHLQRHGKGFRVRHEIPEPLRRYFGGRRFFIKNLGEVAQKQARVIRDQYVAEWKLQLSLVANPEDEVLSQARLLRRRIEHEGDAVYTSEEQLSAHPALEAARLADKLEVARGKEAGDRLHLMMEGLLTPLDEHLDEWFEENGCTEHTATLHRKAFRVLSEWCKARDLEQTLQAITDRIASEFIDKHLKVILGKPKTINRYLSTYRSHWRWLRRKHRIPHNPWLDTAIPERRYIDRHLEEETEKRPFTDDEVKALLSNDPKLTADARAYMKDLMMFGALTGARVDAICSLRVRDCTATTITFKPAKREPKRRTIPIHSKLMKIVARRIAKKEADGFLFHELPDATAKRHRSASASQAFTRYRRKVGVGAGAGEESRVDFHSFRRWFITKAEQAGIGPHIIAAVVGHRRGNITMDLYSGGPTVEKQMKACVEAVKLP